MQNAKMSGPNQLKEEKLGFASHYACLGFLLYLFCYVKRTFILVLLHESAFA